MGVVAALGLSSLAACGEPAPTPAPDPVPTRQTPDPSNTCPSEDVKAEAAPDVESRHREANFWLDRLGPAADEVLLDAKAIAALNAALPEVDGAYRDVLSDEIGDQSRAGTDLEKRGAWIAERIESGKYVEGKPGAYAAAAKIVESATLIDELHVIVSQSQGYCVPTADGLFSPKTTPDASTTWDPDFDRNNCSTLHPGELVRVLRRSEDGKWWHVHAGHSTGWLMEPSWTPALPPARARRFQEARPRATITRDKVELSGVSLRLGTSLPVVSESSAGLRVELPTTKGLVEAELSTDAGVTKDALPFSRRELFEIAFSQLDDPYGWGGRAGGRDCSRFLYDDFFAFGFRLGRHSSVQAQLGTQSIELTGLDETAKRERIRREAQRGVVLLYMPGHIMLYLGQDGDHDYGISSLSEFLTPCEGGPDTVNRLDRVAVTTLDVGRGTERTSFIERINRIAVFGPGAD